jgi:hypothetical protein
MQVVKREQSEFCGEGARTTAEGTSPTNARCLAP